MGQGVIDNIDQTKENGELDQGGQTTRHGVVSLSGIEVGELLIHLLGIFGVFLLDLLHLRAEHSHLDHALLLLDGKGQQDQTGQHSEHHQGQTIVLYQRIAEMQNPAKRDTKYSHSVYSLQWIISDGS